MKKYLLVISFAICMCIVACGGNSTSNSSDSVASTNGNPKMDSIPSDVSGNPDYKKGLDLVSKSDCFTCHQIKEAGTGPAYQDVANKYSNDTVTVNALAQKVIRGGSGVWGTVPMTPHPDISLDDAKAMVKYVLMLKNK